MFGRTRTQQPEAPAEPTLGKGSGKGRPTPSRKEAEARNRHPLVAGTPIRPNATKEEKKAARAAQREAMNASRAKSRQAMVTGDDRYLPARDKGPARRFARDCVDARWSVGEFFLPMAVVILGLGAVPVLSVRYASTALLYTMVVAVAIDAFLLRRRVNAQALARFGDKTPGVAGAGGYAMMRSLQLRMTRMPKPQVKRGEFPA